MIDDDDSALPTTATRLIRQHADVALRVVMVSYMCCVVLPSRVSSARHMLCVQEQGRGQVWRGVDLVHSAGECGHGSPQGAWPLTPPLESSLQHAGDLLLAAPLR